MFEYLFWTLVNHWLIGGVGGVCVTPAKKRIPGIFDEAGLVRENQISLEGECFQANGS